LWFESAVRSAKFVARKQWVVCGADDMQLRVYNYNTMDKIKTFEAHTDYIRSAGSCAAAAAAAVVQRQLKRDNGRLQHSHAIQ
jgi:hypothetical protein